MASRGLRNGDVCVLAYFANRWNKAVAGNACALVEGTIDRNGWCMGFVPNVTRRFHRTPKAKCRYRRHCPAPSSAV